MCEHSLSIPTHLHAPIQVAALLTTASKIHDEHPERFILDRPNLAMVLPVRSQHLARVLDYGFLCNFGGFAYEGTTMWNQLQEFRYAVEDFIRAHQTPAEPPQEVEQAEQVSAEDFEETIKKKRDQIFRKMVDQPEEFDIWGNKISKTEPEEEPEKTPAGLSWLVSPQETTYQLQMKFYGLGFHIWVDETLGEDFSQPMLNGSDQEEPNGDV